jgi:hypothetical protein
MNLLILFFFIGVMEWGLATQRQWSVSRGHANIAWIIGLLENMLSFWVMFQVVQNVDNWWMALSYSLGGALGIRINMWIPI